MKTPITTILVILAAALSAAAQDDKDNAKRSTEQQVLDRFVGEWKTLVTNKTAGTTATGFQTRSWSRDGKDTVLHEESIDLATGAETPALWRYDSENRVYRFALLLPSGWAVLDGTWDEKSATMTWNGKDAWGNRGSGIHRFIDKDQAEWTHAIKNPEGEVLADLSAKQTRVKAIDRKERAGAPVPKRTAEQEVLGRFVGEWKEVAMTNGEASTRMVSKSWSRGGKGTVVHQVGVDRTTGAESALLWHYDSENEVYRIAFLAPNVWSFTDCTWDKKAKSMTWSDYNSSWGGSVSGSQRFIDKDHSEWTFRLKDPTGRVLYDQSGKSSRVGAAAIKAPEADDQVRSIQRLPEDGTWAKYGFDGTEVGNRETGSAIQRMVGTTTEDGQKCRWLEFEWKQDGEEQPTIMKLLIPEKEFAAGANQTPKILRGWMKKGDKAVAKLGDEEKAALGLMALGQHGNAETVKSAKVIDSKKDQLKIATAKRGKRTAQLPEAKPGVNADFTLTVWTHESSPFGAAASNITVTTGKTLVFESTSTLQDYGTGAKSALPDNN